MRAQGHFNKSQIIPALLLFISLIWVSPTANAQQATSDDLTLLKPQSGYSISIFTTNLPGPRLMALTKKGDILVSLTRNNQIILIPASDSTPQAKPGTPILLLEGLNHPHGLAIDGGWLYIAEQTQIVRYPFDAKNRTITGKPEVLLKNIPSGGHSTRTIRKGPDGWFYVSVGSSCNVCIEHHKWRATILRFKPGSKAQIYASGLRNAVGFDWHPTTKKLYSSDHGRDWLGDDLPPGEVNEIIGNGFYGWPFFYGNNIRDKEFGGNYREKSIGKPRAPAHQFTAHVAPLSLKFLKHSKITTNKAIALVTQHGSWNRSKKSGYKVVTLKWDEAGNISQSDFLSGFLQEQKVIGRPVDTLELKDGSVLISDDYHGTIWRMALSGE